ncbi:MAG: hypothetical protein LAO21_14185 [Acidobacteriia bacterium]|nr:hypothetical protein [Terriglobia bacterium]
MFVKLLHLSEAAVKWSWKGLFGASALRRKLREERGQTTLEYLVIVVIMVSLLIAIAMFLSPTFKNLVSNLIKNIQAAITNVSTVQGN